MAIRSMGDMMEVAKLMSVGKQAIPPHLRDNPGACLAVCIQAVEWEMSPFAVANKSYVVNDRLCYESQLIHAVIERRAPLVGRLRHSFSGEGAKRRCKVWASVKGEAEPFEYESPEIGSIKVKNSPLWVSKPDLQLYYNTSRDWARVYFPDVILGVYAKEELEDAEEIEKTTAVPLPVGRSDLRRTRAVIESPPSDEHNQDIERPADPEVQANASDSAPSPDDEEVDEHGVPINAPNKLFPAEVQ